MKERDKPILEYALLILVLIAGIVFLVRLKNQEIYLCQKVFTGLVKGSHRIEKVIDWQELKALDVDVGVTYSQLPNEKERSGYKKAFIANFSKGFKQAGGRLNLFTHWRIYERDAEKTVVAADYLGHNKTILFSVSKGRKKLIAIQWSAQDG